MANSTRLHYGLATTGKQTQGGVVPPARPDYNRAMPKTAPKAPNIGAKPKRRN